MRWEQVSIGDLFLKKSSNRKQKDLVSEGYPVFGASGLSGFAHDFDVQVPYFGVVKDGAGVGRVSVHPAESSVVGTMECLIPKPGLHFEFLGYCLRQVRFERYVTGSTIPHVYFKDYKNEMVALPPLEEQKRIAGILDEADRMRKKTQALIDKYDELAQSLFLDMFGDPVTNPNGWEVVHLSDVCDLLNGYAFKSTDYVEYSETLNCRMSQIRPEGNFDLNHNPKFLPDSYSKKYSRYQLVDGDVVIAMTDLANEPKILGVPTIVRTEGKSLLLNQRVGKLIIEDSNRLSFVYLKCVLAQPNVRQFYKRFAGGGLQINLAKGDLLSIPIPLPPMGLQLKFGELSKNVAKHRQLAEKAESECHPLFNALLQKAFKGELT